MKPIVNPFDEAARTLRRGGVIVYPTDTLWGLGAAIANEAAVEKVFDIKKRPRTEPLSIAVATVDEIEDYAVVTAAARRLFPLLPGPLTLVLEKRSTVPDIVTGGHATVGVRVPAHKECLKLLEQVGALTSTSANLHGGAEPASIREARDILGDRVDFYLDVGSTPLGLASTLVDATKEPVRILRSGALRESRIREYTTD